MRNKIPIIDLTWPLGEASTIYPGDSIVTIEDESTIAEDGFATTRVSFNNHTGSDIDYLSHFFADGLTSSDFTIEKMFDLETLILDFSNDIEKTRISATDISTKIDGSRLDHFKAVIFKTENSQIDLSRSKYTKDYLALDEQAAKLIA